MRKSFLILVLTCASLCSYSQDLQESPNSLKPYSIYLTMGGSPSLLSHGSISVEYAIPNTRNKYRIKPFYSLFSEDNSELNRIANSQAVGLDFVYLTGQQHGLEMSVGIQKQIKYSNVDSALGLALKTNLRANIGYRLSYKSLVVRTGIGLIDRLYAAIGVQF